MVRAEGGRIARTSTCAGTGVRGWSPAGAGGGQGHPLPVPRVDLPPGRDDGRRAGGPRSRAWTGRSSARPGASVEAFFGFVFVNLDRRAIPLRPRSGPPRDGSAATPGRNGAGGAPDLRRRATRCRRRTGRSSSTTTWRATTCRWPIRGSCGCSTTRATGRDRRGLRPLRGPLRDKPSETGLNGPTSGRPRRCRDWPTATGGCGGTRDLPQHPVRPVSGPRAGWTTFPHVGTGSTCPARSTTPRGRACGPGSPSG